MKITHLQAIEALGNLICFYNADLIFIAKFHDFKQGNITDEEYLNNKYGFQKFINEFKVARNVKKSSVKAFMSFARKWVLRKNALDVDSFAKELNKKGITHDGKIMTSLASKILFLNNPEAIVPIDTLNKRAVHEKSNCYHEFISKVNNFKSDNIDVIDKYLTLVTPLLTEVERNHKSMKINFSKYRITRYTDKLLWTRGKK